jgi:methionyl-tRNA formyltransferase
LSVRIVFLGMLGALSALPLARLLAAGADIRAVIVPAPTAGMTLRELPHVAPLSGIPLLPVQAHMLDIARERGVPAWTVSDLRHPDSVAQLRALAPELLIVSCFRHILPASWLAVPPHGAWNLHPSLLPRLRGPDPLFWTFHENVQPGVSVHRMSARVDAGPILAQVPLQFPDGISYAEAERIGAHAGAGLFLAALHALEQGTLSAAPQPESNADHYPLPSRADFIVTEDWNVRHAFNFLRAVAELGAPLLRLAGHDFRVRKAVDYTEGAEMGEAWRISAHELTARLADGVLRVLYFAPEP